MHRGSLVKQEVSVAAASSPAPASMLAPAKGRGPVKMESSDGEEWGREEEGEGEEDDGEPGGRAGGGGPVTPSWSCTQCHSRYSDKESYITHMGELHGKVSTLFHS